MREQELTRRDFAGALGGAVAALAVVGRHAVAGAKAPAPSEKLNIAGIGAGGRGGGDINAVSRGNNVVALCDVDSRRAAGNFKRFPNAKRYSDFRKLFDEMGRDIDAVTVGTPDHTHAVIAMAAIKRRKHVYCEKPLAHSVYEVNELIKAAREYGVVTQLGNQGHSSNTIRMFCEWIWDGAIGNVHTIQLGCRAVNSGLNRLAQVRKERPPVPKTLDWDLWLGPALYRPYHPAYCPHAWRGWTPFGNGTIGDWVCHVVDPVFWALDLGAPRTIVAEVNDWDYKTQGDAFPMGDRVTYEFPAKGRRGPVKMIWHSGTDRIPRPKQLEPGRRHPETGAVVYGDKGTIMYGSHGAGGVRMIPESAMRAYKLPPQKIPRVAGGHHGDWLNAIRKGKKAGSDFALYGGPLTQIAMLGIIAIKLHGTKLQWDAENVRFTNCPEANTLINPPYRKGWTL